MHLLGHIASSLPFFALGMPAAGVGAMFPDVTWVHNELRFRRSSVRPWERWVEGVTPRMLRPYRIAHSVFLPCACLCYGWYNDRAYLMQFAAGWLLHISLDLPTHWGIMRQQPLYPIKWRWPWSFKN